MRSIIAVYLTEVLAPRYGRVYIDLSSRFAEEIAIVIASPIAFVAGRDDPKSRR